MAPAGRKHTPEISTGQQTVLARECLTLRPPVVVGLRYWWRVLGSLRPDGIFGRQENLGCAIERGVNRARVLVLLPSQLAGGFGQNPRQRAGVRRLKLASGALGHEHDGV